MNTLPDLSNLEYLAGVRLSELGYRRFMRMFDSGAKEPELREYIDRAEARELTLSCMVRCAPMRSALQ